MTARAILYCRSELLVGALALMSLSSSTSSGDGETAPFFLELATFRWRKPSLEVELETMMGLCDRESLAN